MRTPECAAVRSDVFSPVEAKRSVRRGSVRRWAGSYLVFVIFLTAGGVVCLAEGVRREGSEREIALLDRVNPNTATPGSLIRLEGIGRVRAYAIVEYREANAAEGRTVFASPQDLQAIVGIGPKTVEKIARQLDCGAEEF